MNLMPDSVCVKNLASIGDDTEINYLKALKENNFICAGSVPTRDGINACWVKFEWTMSMNQEYYYNIFVSAGW